MDYEYTRFGDTIQRRIKDSTDDWEDVPEEDMPDALVEVRAAELERERHAANPRRMTARITRGGG